MEKYEWRGHRCPICKRPLMMDNCCWGCKSCWTLVELDYFWNDDDWKGREVPNGR